MQHPSGGAFLPGRSPRTGSILPQPHILHPRFPRCMQLKEKSAHKTRMFVTECNSQHYSSPPAYN
jgi:hypothetical protein